MDWGGFIDDAQLPDFRGRGLKGRLDQKNSPNFPDFKGAGFLNQWRGLLAVQSLDSA